MTQFIFEMPSDLAPFVERFRQKSGLPTTSEAMGVLARLAAQILSDPATAVEADKAVNQIVAAPRKREPTQKLSPRTRSAGL